MWCEGGALTDTLCYLNIRSHFKYSKPELSNMAEQELSVTEGKQLGATVLQKGHLSLKEEGMF